jgi:hypothetical protein
MLKQENQVDHEQVLKDFVKKQRARIKRLKGRNKPKKGSSTREETQPPL